MNEIEALEAKLESLSAYELLNDPERIVAQMRLMNYLAFVTAPLGQYKRGFTDEQLAETLAQDGQSQGTPRCQGAVARGG